MTEVLHVLGSVAEGHYFIQTLINRQHSNKWHNFPQWPNIRHRLSLNNTISSQLKREKKDVFSGQYFQLDTLHIVVFRFSLLTPLTFFLFSLL